MMQSVDPQRDKRRLTPVGVALLYAVFAALWITVSGVLLNMSVDDPVLQGRIEIAKGLLFVAVTSSLLYVVLREWGTSISRAAASRNAIPASSFCAKAVSRRAIMAPRRASNPSASSTG